MKNAFRSWKHPLSESQQKREHESYNEKEMDAVNNQNELGATPEPAAESSFWPKPCFQSVSRL